MAQTFGGIRPLTEFRQSRTGAQVQDVNRDRIAQRGLGIDDTLIARGTSPLIRASRGRFEGSTVPALQSRLSAIGAGRNTASITSSQPGSLAPAFAEQGRREDEIFGQSFLQNELLKRQELENALNRGERITQADINTRFSAAQFDLGESQFERRLESTETQAARDRNQQLILAAAAAAAAPFTGGASLGLLGAGGFSGGAGDTFRGPESAGGSFIPQGVSGEFANQQRDRLRTLLGVSSGQSFTR